MLVLSKAIKASKLANKRLTNVLCNLNICPIAEYACPVLHNGLQKYLADELDRLQKCALRKVFSHQLSYREALAASNLSSLYDRRDSLTKEFFHDIVPNGNHKLHCLLPDQIICNINLRNERNFNVPKCSTNRLKNIFIYSIVN